MFSMQGKFDQEFLYCAWNDDGQVYVHSHITGFGAL